MAGNQRCTFVDRDPIYLLAVTSTGEPREYIEKQLDYLYHQVLFVLTGSVLTRLRKRPNYDVRDLMGGASPPRGPRRRRAPTQAVSRLGRGVPGPHPHGQPPRRHSIRRCTERFRQGGDAGAGHGGAALGSSGAPPVRCCPRSPARRPPPPGC